MDKSQRKIDISNHEHIWKDRSRLHNYFNTIEGKYKVATVGATFQLLQFGRSHPRYFYQP